MCARNGENIVLSSVTREIDLKTPLVQQKTTMVVENQGESAFSQFVFAVDPTTASQVSYIGAKLETGDSAMDLVVVQGASSGTIKGAHVYTVHMPALVAKKSATVIVNTIFVNAISPFPEEITQNMPQLVQFSGNVYLYSPYPSTTQSTIVTVPSDKIESFSKVSPTSSSEKEITYGPYSNVEPKSAGKLIVHFENNGPFLSVAELVRIIEVSHWGNIAVEEHLHIKHTGARLQGSFSRYDFQRNPNSGPSSVKSYVSMLPAAARDVYYRDEIGNISTSNLREEEEFVSLELRPRFPLFGGWQTRYYMGYNLPSYEHLYHNGNQYLLKMRFIDHVFDNQIVEKVTVKIILPEGARDINLEVPYVVNEEPTKLHYTYLDTVGRPVVMATGSNLVEQHILDFKLSYTFDKIMLLQEPLLVVGALYLFFLLVVVIVRLDFSITKDVALLTKQQASVIIESILTAHDKRATLVGSYEKAVTTLKSSEDAKGFKKSKKSLDDQFSSNTTKISALVKDLQATDPDAGAKVTELQRKVADLKAALDESCMLAENLVNQRIGKQKYLDQDKASQSRIKRLREEIDVIVQGLD